jgi:hypothetical protein
MCVHTRARVGRYNYLIINTKAKACKPVCRSSLIQTAYVFILPLITFAVTYQTNRRNIVKANEQNTTSQSVIKRR